MLWGFFWVGVLVWLVLGPPTPRPRLAWLACLVLASRLLPREVPSPGLGLGVEGVGSGAGATVVAGACRCFLSSGGGCAPHHFSPTSGMVGVPGVGVVSSSSGGVQSWCGVWGLEGGVLCWRWCLGGC